MGKSLSKVVWFDPRVFQSENTQLYNELRELIDVERFNSQDEVEAYIRSKAHLSIILISSGNKGKQLLERIHQYKNLSQVIIFCGNKKLHQEWTMKYSKIKSLCDFHGEVFSAVEQAIKLNEISLSLGSENEFSKTKKLVDCQISKSPPDKVDFNQEQLYVISASDIDAQTKFLIMYCYQTSSSISNAQICDELFLQISNQKKQEEIKKTLYDQHKSDRYLAVTSLYTSNLCYSELNAACARCQLIQFKNTFAALFSQIIRNQEKNLQSQQTLYRAVFGYDRPKQTGYWSSFTSTTTSLPIAKKFLQYDGPQTILVIKLDQNQPHPHVDLKSVSVHQEEKEILILPYCPIREVSRRKEGNIEYIEVVQDSKAEPIFSTDIKVSMKYWEDQFFKKLETNVEKLTKDIIIKAQEELDVCNYFKSNEFNNSFDDMFVSFESQMKACPLTKNEELHAFIKTYFKEQIISFLPKSLEKNLKGKIEDLTKSYTSDLQKAIGNEIQEYISTFKFSGINEAIRSDSVKEESIADLLIGLFVNYVNRLKDEVLDMIEQFRKLNRPFNDQFKENVRNLIDDSIVSQTGLLAQESRKLQEDFKGKVDSMNQAIIPRIKDIFNADNYLTRLSKKIDMMPNSSQ